MLIIGEKINATLSSIRARLINRDAAPLIDLARRQAEAGADYIDVNVGTGVGSRQDEMTAMQWVIGLLNAAVETPICIDSADPGVIETGLDARQGKPAMINSVKAETEYLESVLPLAARHRCPVVALAMDERGIPTTSDARIEACEKIAEACERLDIPLNRVYFDPLVMPVSTDAGAGRTTLETLRKIKERFPKAKTVTGLSNVSYGLPRREKLNAAFLHMAIYAGLDAAIVNPLNADIMAAVAAGEALAGKDRHCRRYLRAFRNKPVG